ncbi:thioesterase family protein [Enterococcus asini]|uniref:thioesterase family protein n=1 Tax=Enterococcus asini TaxID=57732 RepID=UPI001E60C84B|nr:thioesterase family protein [Enterococcus asini]MCD5028992.1 thioesterase family protein [Enterococcus asini]MDT2783978.1 thioesterase family protein [Enterococcus asini]
MDQTFAKEYTVTADLTAEAMGSGGIPVLATPAMVTMVENACYGELQKELKAEETSVGGFLSIEHLAPSPVGATVTVRAALYEHAGTKVVFSFTVYEGEKLVGKGNHERFIVKKECFLSKLS